MIAVLDASLWLRICRLSAAVDFSLLKSDPGVNNIGQRTHLCVKVLWRPAFEQGLRLLKAHHAQVTRQPCLKKGALKPSLQTCVSFSSLLESTVVAISC